MRKDKYKPYRGQGSIENEIYDLIQNHFAGIMRTGPVTGEWLLPIDVEESVYMIKVTAYLPGLSMDEIDVSLDGLVLTIQGEQKPGKDHRAGENKRGSFKNSIRLNTEVRKDRIKAEFEQNRLTILIPKMFTNQKIKITESQSS